MITGRRGPKTRRGFSPHNPLPLTVNEGGDTALAQAEDNSRGTLVILKPTFLNKGMGKEKKPSSNRARRRCP